MESIKIKGIVKGIGDIVERNNFKKRDLIVKTAGEYPQVFAIEFINSREELLDMIDIGDEVTVHVNLRGREWVNDNNEKKYFTSLVGWKIDS